jgi:hypothetical protein
VDTIKIDFIDNKYYRDLIKVIDTNILSDRDTELVESLSEKAFSKGIGKEWNDIQYFLFYLNLRMMNKGFSLGTVRADNEWTIRGIIERVEKKYLKKELIPEVIGTTQDFLVWLKKRILEHRVNHSPLFEVFDRDELSENELRYFLANYRVNMQRFHLHVAAYSLIVPFGMREELYHNLYDEFGQGDFRKAHPNLFEPLMEYFGGATDEDINPETCHLLNTKINLCWFADGLHYGLGGMGGLELSIPMQQKRVLAHLRRRGLNENLVDFFVVHCELDEEHGDGWFAAGAPYISTNEDYQKVFDGVIRMLDARARVYDGVLEGIHKHRNSKQSESRSKQITMDSI